MSCRHPPYDVFQELYRLGWKGAADNGPQAWGLRDLPHVQLALFDAGPTNSVELRDVLAERQSQLLQRLA